MRKQIPGLYLLLWLLIHFSEPAFTQNIYNTPEDIDLLRTDMCISDTLITKGEYIHVKSTLRNNGTSQAPFHITSYLLTKQAPIHPDSIFPKDTYYLMDTYHEPLDPGAEIKDSVDLFIPHHVPSGNYYIIIATDLNAMIQENNRANNLIYLPITIESHPIDLYPSEIEIKMGMVAGSITKVTHLEHVEGTSFVSGYFFTLYLSTDNDLDSLTDLMVHHGHAYQLQAGPNEITSFFTVPNVTPGDYYLFCVSDSEHDIEETDEHNNITYSRVTVLEGDIDLTIGNIETRRLTFGASTYLETYYFALNSGIHDAGNHFTRFVISEDDELDSSDHHLGSFFVPTVPAPTSPAPAQIAYLNITDHDAGQYHLFAIADHLDQIPETDEHNNITSKVITIEPQDIDLLPIITQPIITMTQGSRYDLSHIIRNQGTSSTGYFINQYKLSKQIVPDTTDVVVGHSYVFQLDGGSEQVMTPTLTIPFDIEPGQYYLTYSIDHDKYVKESDRSNNIAHSIVTLNASDIDLYVRSSQPDIEVHNDQYFEFSYEIGNIGTTTAYYPEVYYYLSTDTIFDTGDRYVEGTHFQKLEAAINLITTGFGYGPKELAAGDYYLLYVVDPNDHITESNKANNISYTRLKLRSAHVDLVVHNFQVTALDNRFVDLYAEIGNQGSITVQSSILEYVLSTDTLYDPSDIVLSTQSVPMVSPGHPQALRTQGFIPLSVPDGDYYLICKIDAHDEIEETNKLNNVLYKPFRSEASNADLTIAFSTTEVVGQREMISIKKILYNSGSTTAPPSNTAIYFSLDSIFDPQSDVFLAMHQNTSLNAQESRMVEMELSLPFNISSGHYLIAVANFDKMIKEQSYDNNIAYNKLTILDSDIDLEVVISTSDLESSMPMVDIIIYNHGADKINSTFETFLYFSQDSILDTSDEKVGIHRVHALDGQSSIHGRIKLDLRKYKEAGIMYLLAVVDPHNVIAESNKNNNVDRRTFLYSAPVTNIAISSPDTVVNINLFGQTQIRTLLENKGTATAAPGQIRFYVSDRPTFDSDAIHVNTSLFDTLAPGEARNRVDLVLLKGDMRYEYLLISAETGHLDEDSDLSDNLTVIRFSDTSPTVDLAISDIRLNHPFVTHGGPFNVDIEIANHGNTDVPGFEIQCYLSQDAVFDPTDQLIGGSFASISKNASQKTKVDALVSAHVPEGDYFLIMVADPSKRIYEADRNNNTAVIPVRVEIPRTDVVLRNIVTSDNWKNSALVHVTFDDYNAGNTYIKQHKIASYLSNDTTLNDSAILLFSVLSGELQAGETKTLSRSIIAPSQLASGPYYLLMIADMNNGLDEVDEENTIWKQVNISLPEIDLQVTIPQLSMNSAIAGSDLRLSYYLYNEGKDAAYNTTTHYYISQDMVLDNTDRLIGASKTEMVHPGISEFISAQVKLPQDLQAGNYFVIVQADGAGDQVETDKTNNTAYRSITIRSATIDLSLRNVSIDNNKPLPGDNLLVSCNVANTGNSDAGATTLGFYLAKEKHLTSQAVLLQEIPINGTGAGSVARFSTELIIPENPADGNYQILIVVDAHDQVVETNEANNTVARQINIKTPKKILKGEQAAPVAEEELIEEEAVMDIAGIIKANSFVVAPNPVKDQINLTLQGRSDASDMLITLYDAIGQMRYTLKTELMNGATQIPTTDLAPGMYILKIEHYGQVQTITVFKD